MKYQVKIDAWLRFTLFIVFLYLLGMSVLVFTEGIWFVSIFTLPLSIFTISLIISSEIEFTEEYLLIKIGFIRAKVLYSKITELEIKQKIFTNGFALSRDIIRITTSSKIMRTVDISPLEREEVLRELQKRSGLLKENRYEENSY